MLTAPAVWTNPAEGRIWLLVGTSSGLSGLTVDLGPGNVPKLTTHWQDTSNSATSPTVANGVLFATGGTSTGGTHWQSPVESRGWLVFADNSGHLTAWGL